jgi:hypothetical protein
MPNRAERGCSLLKCNRVANSGIILLEYPTYFVKILTGRRLGVAAKAVIFDETPATKKNNNLVLSVYAHVEAGSTVADCEGVLEPRVTHRSR